MPEVVENLVSVITPVYNRPLMLRQAVESVLAQTWKSFEIIISDDGSSDETRDVGRGLQKQYPGIVRYIWNPNRGAGPAREAGRQLARGEFIQYLDSDDTVWPRKFQVQVEALRSRPGCGAAYGFIRLCPEGGAPVEKPYKWSGRALPTLFPWLLVDRWWNTNAPLWRRSVCDAIGAWSDLRYSQDWEYDARAGALGVQLAHTPEFVCDQRHHDEARQTGGGRWLDPPDRVRFFESLNESACIAGVDRSSPERRHFSRWVFSHARSSAIVGDARSARRLFQLAGGSADGFAPDMMVFGVMARIAGWRVAALLAERLHGALRAGPSDSTLKQSWMEADDGP